MKPWDNPCNQATCINCGRTGWTWKAEVGWFGNPVCKDGCDPEEVKAYQRKKLREQIKQQRERESLVSEGAGI